MKHERKHFTGVPMLLSGNEFVGCTFERCILVFDGEKPIGLDNCKIIQCQVRLAGKALAIQNLFRDLYHGGFPGLVETIFADIRENSKGPQYPTTLRNPKSN